MSGLLYYEDVVTDIVKGSSIKGRVYIKEKKYGTSLICISFVNFTHCLTKSGLKRKQELLKPSSAIPALQGAGSQCPALEIIG